jgi:C-terminal processing protease CtpA/Prc
MPSHTDETPETSSQLVQMVALRREAVVPTADRGRLAALIASCALAGLAGGMTLSLLAESHRIGAQTRAVALRSDVGSGGLTWLGVRIETLDADRCAGARVVSVSPGSPAAEAGVQRGDLVLTFGGDRVCGAAHLQDVVRASAPGATPDVGLHRRGETFVVRPTLELMPGRVRSCLPASER